MKIRVIVERMENGVWVEVYRRYFGAIDSAENHKSLIEGPRWNVHPNWRALIARVH